MQRSIIFVMDYIIRKAAESSLLGLSQTLNRSPLAEEIEARGEAAYRPKGWEKGAGRVLGATADAVMMGGAGSWATLAKFVMYPSPTRRA